MIRTIRHFQLLEILIALFLIIVCAIPLVQTYVAMHIDQKEQNKVVDANQLIEEVHAKLIEDFFRKKIGFEHIEEQLEHEIDDIEIVKKAKQLNYKITYQFVLERPKNVISSTKHLLAQINIKLSRIDDETKKPITVLYYLYAILS